MPKTSNTSRRKKEEELKTRVTISISPEDLDYMQKYTIEQIVGGKRTFKISHAFADAIKLLRKSSKV